MINTIRRLLSSYHVNKQMAKKGHATVKVEQWNLFA